MLRLLGSKKYFQVSLAMESSPASGDFKFHPVHGSVCMKRPGRGRRGGTKMQKLTGEAIVLLNGDVGEES